MIKLIGTTLLTASLVLTGCATITGSGKQTVEFDTTQEGLALYNYKGKKKLCDLPCSLQLDGNSIRYFFAKGEGYKHKVITLDIKRNKATYANLISLAAFTDSMTGADTTLQSYVFIELEKLDTEEEAHE